MSHNFSDVMININILNEAHKQVSNPIREHTQGRIKSFIFIEFDYSREQTLILQLYYPNLDGKTHANQLGDYQYSISTFILCSLKFIFLRCWYLFLVGVYLLEWRGFRDTDGLIRFFILCYYRQAILGTLLLMLLTLVL
jgi:hypothetical protein